MKTIFAATLTLAAVSYVADARAEDTGAKEQLPRAIMSREEFIKRCKPGRPQKECREGMGEPARVARVAGEDTWYYDIELMDPASGKKTSRVQVLFNEDRRVRGLDFY